MCTASSLEKAFDSHKVFPEELSQPVTQEQSTNSQVYDDDLARTAGEILQTVSQEENPKFKNSQFMTIGASISARLYILEMMRKSPAGYLVIYSSCSY